jgi:putative hemolysin
MYNIIIPVLLIFAQGIFTSAETAVLTVEKSVLGRARHEKKRWAFRVHDFLAAPHRFFSTILVCEDFLLVIASTLFARFFILRFGSQYIILSTIILAFFSLIAGQYLPKAIALAYPEKTLMALSNILYFIEAAVSPVVFIYSRISGSIAYFFTSRAKEKVIRHQDIISAMSEYEKDSSLLASRLFDFCRRTAGEVMMPIEAALMCRKNEDLKSVCMNARQVFTTIPVYEEVRSNVIGVINTKDYYYEGTIRINPAFFVNVNERCMHIFLIMQEKKEHLGIVRDDNNHAVGLISMNDLVEELVGEIREER